MGEGWQLMKIQGIPLRVHPSWFVVLLLFTWISQKQVLAATETSLPVWISWSLGFITALLLFMSVLLHELGHSLVALREGVKVRSITLFFLGGVAKVERECSTPMASLRVAAAGPLVSFVLAISLLAVGVQAAGHIDPLFANLVKQLGGLNLLLAIFNLLPGLPLDGGLILKALVWQWTGSQRKGVQVATATGRVLSLSAMVLGGWLFFFKGGGVSGLWLLILGWFGLSASRSQTQLLALQKVLRELNVGQAAGRNFRVLEDDQSLRRLSQLRLGSSEENLPQEWVLVCRSGRWVGYMTDQPLKELPVQQWDRQCLADHMKPIDELPSIGEKAPLWQAVMALEQAEEGRLLVFNIAGLPSGTLDRVDLAEAVLKRLGVRLPAQFVEAARSQNTYPLGMALPQVVDSMVSGGMVELPEGSSIT
ncbi:MAG: site-2 protease family protein [Prochlorococcaceae cyanobacterium ETNP2_MAG_10]|nr:site-2 protease family protein [Prochlorococcaceae cyanobacterium ETNP2_MAG_10]